MRAIAWLVIIGAIAGIGFLLLRLRKRWQEQKQVAEARLASFVAGTIPAQAKAPLLPPSPAPDPDLGKQRLLLDAAGKVAEAGEPALSIQIFARLLSRYPQTQFAGQARAAVAALKQKV
jgi:hypothetical protein